MENYQKILAAIERYVHCNILGVLEVSYSYFTRLSYQGMKAIPVVTVMATVIRISKV